MHVAFGITKMVLKFVVVNMKIMNLRKLMIVAAVAVCQTAAMAQAKYVFYFIGDGMGWGHVNAAQYYNRIVRGADKPLLMMQFPSVGSAFTYSASSPVTDSAAAGTALATGKKTRNGMVGLAPDSVTVYESIAAKLKKQGWGVGVLTSVSADDATPAAFYGHQPYRGMRYELDCDAARSNFDFIGGANLAGIDKDNDAQARLAKAGYTMIRDTKAKEAKKADKLILLSPQDKSDIGYTIDSIAGALNLPEMTAMALTHMEKVSPKHFFLMVEGGNIDHAAHSNDGGAVIKEILAFQDAIRVAYNFYLAHPDETLIVVTADHDTGGLALNGNVNLAAADFQRISKDEMSDHFKSLVKAETPISWEEMKSYLTQKLSFWNGIKISDKQEDALKKAFDKTFVARTGKDEKGLYNSFNEFVTEVYKVMNSHIGTHFTTRSHSANPVPVFAIGKGAEAFGVMQDNTEIPAKIMEATR